MCWHIFLLSMWWHSTVSAYAIPASYGTATHNTTAWQELNDSTNNTSGYGVSWSTDGSNWGHEILYVGQNVKFKFDMHKKNVGTHYADHMKAWLDWDQDGAFEEGDDVIAYGERTLITSEANNLGSWNQPNVTDFTFFSDEFEILGTYVGDTWLRARVTCSHSLVNSISGDWNDQWTGLDYESLFLSTGYYGQGEVEEWKITVAPVPEPSTILLLSSGLFGLGWYGRKRKKA